MRNPLRIGMIAGEVSGDLLGAGLIQALQKIIPQCQFDGIGGPHMQSLGFESLVPMSRLSVMGFIEPLGRLPELLRIEKKLLQHFINDPPDVFVGIDSPGFNIRFEKKLHAAGIPTVHYVSPSVWAYAEKRIRNIKLAVDLMLVLFPFETDIYQAHGIAVKCVGHPLADSIGFDDNKTAARSALGLEPDQRIIALLPGSRPGEIRRLAPVYFQTASKIHQRYPQLQFVLPCANSEAREMVEQLLAREGASQFVTLVNGQSQQTMAAADLVILASGTATLEALLLKKPMVICYKLAPLTYAVASRMLRVPYVGLPNLLAGEKLVPEYLQSEVTVANLYHEIESFIQQGAMKIQVKEKYEEIHRHIARGANDCAAEAILDFCRQSSYPERPSVSE